MKRWAILPSPEKWLTWGQPLFKISQFCSCCLGILHCQAPCCCATNSHLLLLFLELLQELLYAHSNALGGGSRKRGRGTYSTRSDSSEDTLGMEPLGKGWHFVEVGEKWERINAGCTLPERKVMVEQKVSVRGGQVVGGSAVEEPTDMGWLGS